jgi:hypothetical protein
MKAKGSGSCIVMSIESASGSNPAVSLPTTLTFTAKASIQFPHFTIFPAVTTSILSAADETAIPKLAKRLRSSDRATSVVYASRNVKFVLVRAKHAVTYRTSRVRVSLTLKEIGNSRRQQGCGESGERGRGVVHFSRERSKLVKRFLAMRSESVALPARAFLGEPPQPTAEKRLRSSGCTAISSTKIRPGIGHFL